MYHLMINMPFVVKIVAYKTRSWIFIFHEWYINDKKVQVADEIKRDIC